ncbi:MAG: DUF1573 domain-containing protein, partial [Phycisphaerae bacterium]
MHKQALLILVLALGAPGGASAWGDGVRGARRYMAAARQGGDPAVKPQPRLVVPHANQKLPPIREGKVLPVVFRLENRGQADLLIHSAKSSCGCTTVSLTKDQKRIPPGGHVDLKVRFNSLGRPGVQNKSVTIQTNDPQAARAVLRFRVEVRTLFRTVPGQKYILGNARRGEKLAKPLDLLPTGEDMELEVMSVEVPKGVFRYEASALPVKNAVGQRLRLTVNEYAPLGPVSGMIDIKVRVADEEETRQLRVVGAILGDVVVSPERIRLDRPSVRGIYLRPVE